MGSDRARISYDPSRTYRSVVAQQGRVTLEADINEAAMIAVEERRLEAIDVIGPAGTPDDGYKVSGGTGVTIGAGTMYVGGWRMELPKPVTTDKQPDWLDMPASKDTDGDQLVVLKISEQAVSAVEDHALREVALGGPDTSARNRLMQRFLRLPVKSESCAGAAKALNDMLAAEGAALDPHSLELTSTARLQVGFVAAPAASGPCDPPAQGGYLGADNQLIMVTVTSFDAASKTGKLAWSWNNASFLYRASVVNGTSLLFDADPVDAEHMPRLGQAVEILRTSADLGNGDYIAAPQGLMITLDQAYASDTHTLALPAPGLPAAYKGDAPRPLFVRLWETELAFTSGKAVVLDTSGVTVTITMAAMPVIADRPYWSFAVRPSTPVLVYPHRYIDAPQPPEGPRQWLCDLAVIVAKDRTVQVLDDCRHTFDPLIDRMPCRCCCLVVGPEDVKGGAGLQGLIDKLAGGPATLSLLPGNYQLNAPLVLDGKNAGLTLEGCQPNGAVLSAVAGQEEQFALGLIRLNQANNVTLRNLRFQLPTATASQTAVPPLRTLAAGGGATAVAAKVLTSVGIMPVNTSGLAVEDCQFRFPAPDAASLLTIGIYARGGCASPLLKGNVFTMKAAGANDPARLAIGFALLTETSGTAAQLTDAEIIGNRFEGLTLAVTVMAQIGLVTCRDNIVRRCAGGFYFTTPNRGVDLLLARQAMTSNSLGATMIREQPYALMSSLSQLGDGFPLEPVSAAPPAPDRTPQAANQLLAQDFRTRAAGLSDLMMSTAAVNAAPEMIMMSTNTGAAATIATDPLMENYLVSLNAISVIGGLFNAPPRPVLHITGNDMEITGVVAQPAATSPGAGIDLGRAVLAESATATLALNTPPPAAAPGAATPSPQATPGRLRANALNINPAAAARINEAGAFSAAATAASTAQPAAAAGGGRPAETGVNIAGAQLDLAATATRPVLPFDGIHVTLTQANDSGMTLVRGNRVETGHALSYAVALTWPFETVLAGNVLIQKSRTGDMPRCVKLLTDPKLSFSAVTGNVILGSLLIQGSNDVAIAGNTVSGRLLPTARQSNAATNSWPFLNTIG